MAQPLNVPTLPEDALMQREYSQLDSKLTGLHQNSLYVEQMLQDLYELLADKRAFLAALPTLKPVVGYFTSGFGVRHSPLGDGRVKMHEGVDIANHLGTQVHAPADGIVIFAGVKAGYGNTLIIDHGYGLETWYGHTKQLLVSKGQRVKKGDAIALLGSTGRSTGPHLHYEVRVNGTPVDPLSYILEDT
jgi:murein DD-endopeptidase MepM/ murein hydrolase activator NlpD